MNKKEISEIKKTLNPEKGIITKICGCYVDNEKNIRFTSEESFNRLSEEEAFKYFDIFKHVLSGSIGKNLMNINFSLKEEKEGGHQKFLYELRESKLNDKALLDEFYKSVVEDYVWASNYYIILIHGVYDIPGRSTDGTEIEDASENVYEYILGAICPVNLEKSGLSYNQESNSIGERVRSWVVDTPHNGFLFPAFNDRVSDVHSVLYYSKDPKNIQTSLIDRLFGEEPPETAGEQKESFNDIIKETFGEECTFEAVKTIHEEIAEIAEEAKDNPDPVVLTKAEVKAAFEKGGADKEQIDSLEEKLKEKHDNFMLNNVISTRNFEIKVPDITVKIKPEMMHLLSRKEIDGRKCLVIEINDNLEINGIPVK